MSAILDVRRLEVTYHAHEGRLQALHDVSFAIQPGEIVGLVGESGCGKTTVASALMQLLPSNGEISGGEVLFQGRDLRGLPPAELRGMRGRDLAMIFQDPMESLNPVFSIWAQIRDVQLAHPRQPRTSEAGSRAEAIAMLEKVGIPDAAVQLDHFPHQFSGGMRQRIMIAMALMSRPALLIADEPTSALDVTLEAQILALIKELQRSFGTSILYITHDLGVVAQLCDRVIVMYAGRVVEQQEVTALYQAPLHPYTQALLASVPSRKRRGEPLASIPGRVPSLLDLPVGCKFVDRCKVAQEVCQRGEPPVLESAGGQARCYRYDPTSGYIPERPLPQVPTQPAGPTVGRGKSAKLNVAMTPGSEERLLRLQGVSTHFYDRFSLLDSLMGKQRGVVRAVDQVDLAIKPGEILGLVGESGSGKTTLGRTVLHLVAPSQGQILFSNRDITALSPSGMRHLRSQIQMIFQDPCASLSPRLRVAELLMEPYKIHRVPKDQRYSVSELLSMVGLAEEQAAKYPHELSGGQARRVSIARAVALSPQFLVADEPTAGLDVSVAASILNLMKGLASQLGLTYIIITHNLNIVGYVADRVAVMYLGKLIEVGATHQIFDRHAHPYTMALLSAVSEPDPLKRLVEKRQLLSGEIPSPRHPPSGCHFHPRCRFAASRCAQEAPPLVEIDEGHLAACHYWPAVQAEVLASAANPQTPDDH